ncbi:TPA: tRNA (guanosine(46)-N7)-methyltransferase TrmB [Candidatus Saccharibacteria bacterium]|nr:tRNA (guanosine(46)-N7)-methyltransferase TrmB [Candidatus Saccharibacteria bacterium]
MSICGSIARELEITPRDTMNPNDYIITRKRKKYKFAKIFNSPICFEFDEWKKRAVDVIELGAGTGLFSVELATRHPEKTYVAIDVKADRLQKGAYEAAARGLENIVFIRARADQITELFPAHSASELWLTFPDPFPKKRSERRRMCHAYFLDKYAQVLKKNGTFYLKHDNLSFFTWSLEQLVTSKWHIDELSFDLHESDLADDYKILTTYETRWLKEGALTNFLAARKLIQ